MNALRRLWWWLRGWVWRRSSIDKRIEKPQLPETFLRGLRHKSCYKPSTRMVTADAFMPSDKSLEDRKKNNLIPFGYDASINWEDDAGAIANLRGAEVAKYGVVRVRHQVIIDTITAVPECRGKLECERRPLRDNAYHGNIVFLEGIDKPVLLLLAGYLALEARFVEEGV